jgi:hypothetical protein
MNTYEKAQSSGSFYTAYSYQKLELPTNIGEANVKGELGIVTKTENIKTDSTKILRPTHFSGSKNIKTDSFFVSLNLSKRWRIRPKI